MSLRKTMGPMRSVVGVLVARALRSGREAEAKRRDRSACREGVALGGQVVAFVEDETPEPRAEMAHVQVRRVVRGDGDGLHVVAATADDADGPAERLEQALAPLAHELERGRHHQRRAFAVGDGGERHVRLARAGGQHDDAAALGLEPRRQRLGLVRARLRDAGGVERQHVVVAGVVGEGEPVLAHPQDQTGVGRGRTPQTTEARVERKRRRRFHLRLVRNVVQLEGAAAKTQARARHARGGGQYPCGRTTSHHALPPAVHWLALVASCAHSGMGPTR